MDERLWILGAPDPEMEAIEALLRECEERVAYATDDSGRVRPGSAVRATGAHVAPGEALPLETLLRAHLCTVECAFGGQGWPVVFSADHHRPGDPGFGRPPAEFLAASSLGQVIAEMARLGRLDVRGWAYDRPPRHSTARVGDVRVAGIGSAHPKMALRPWSVVAGTTGAPVLAEIPRRLVLTAAADHCLGSAYRGECPGVDPDELMRWRAESRAQFQGRSVEEVLADVERAQELIRHSFDPACREGVMLYHECPRCGGDGRETSGPSACLCPDPPTLLVADMRRAEPVPELPEAALRLGIGYVSGPLVTPDGRRKYTCSGTPEVVRAFLDHWAPAQGLADCYGDPMRGFAGGYDVG